MNQRTFMTQLREQLSAEEARVWDVLQEHRGKGQAITNAEIARQAEVPERLARWCLKSLTEAHRKPIGSLPGRGVFIVADLDERQEVIRFYKNHALSLLKRMCILERYNTEALLGQIKLNLDELAQEMTG